MSLIKKNLFDLIGKREINKSFNELEKKLPPRNVLRRHLFKFKVPFTLPQVYTILDACYQDILNGDGTPTKLPVNLENKIKGTDLFLLKRVLESVRNDIGVVTPIRLEIESRLLERAAILGHIGSISLLAVDTLQRGEKFKQDIKSKKIKDGNSNQSKQFSDEFQQEYSKASHLLQQLVQMKEPFALKSSGDFAFASKREKLALKLYLDAIKSAEEIIYVPPSPLSLFISGILGRNQGKDSFLDKYFYEPPEENAELNPDIRYYKDVRDDCLQSLGMLYFFSRDRPTLSKNDKELDKKSIVAPDTYKARLSWSRIDNPDRLPKVHMRLAELATNRKDWNVARYHLQKLATIVSSQSSSTSNITGTDTKGQHGDTFNTAMTSIIKLALIEALVYKNYNISNEWFRIASFLTKRNSRVINAIYFPLSILFSITQKSPDFSNSRQLWEKFSLHNPQFLHKVFNDKKAIDIMQRLDIIENYETTIDQYLEIKDDLIYLLKNNRFSVNCD